MKKRTEINKRNYLGIIGLSLVLGLSSIGPSLAMNSVTFVGKKAQASTLEQTSQTTKLKTNKAIKAEKLKQEKVKVILNGDTIDSYAAIDSITTDLTESNTGDSSMVSTTSNGTYRNSNPVEKIDLIGSRIENIVNTLTNFGNTTFGSIIGVLIASFVVIVGIILVIFFLGFPVWVILFFIWLYRRIRRNREEQRHSDRESFTQKEKMYHSEARPNSDSTATNKGADNFAQHLNNDANEHHYREEIMATNRMIESSIKQIFVGLGVGFFLAIFVSFTMGIAIGILIVAIGVGKNISGKQRLKNIKEYYEEKRYANEQHRPDMNPNNDGKTTQQAQSIDEVNAKEEEDNRQQL